MNDSKLPQIRPQTKAQTKPETLSPSGTNQTLQSLNGFRQNRFLLLSAGTAVGAAVGIFLFSQSILLSIVFGIVGIGLFAADQLVKKSLASTSSENLSLPESPQQRLDEIRKQVSKCKFLEKVEKEGMTAADQAVQMVQQYKNLQSILAQKFEPTELTFSRYSESIWLSCMAIGEDLLHVKSLLENLNLANPNASSEARSQWQQQQAQVTSVLEANTLALNELSNLFTSINQIMTKEKYRDQLEDSMQQIRTLAERAKQYSKH